MQHYILSTLIDNQSDAGIIHLWANNALCDAEKANEILKVGESYKDTGVDEVFVLSIPESVAQRCSVKTVLLKISQNSQENNCSRASV